MWEVLARLRLTSNFQYPASMFISGIQQIGIGVSNVHEAFKWYRIHFGMDVPIFEEAAVAGLMLPYTGGLILESLHFLDILPSGSLRSRHISSSKFMLFLYKVTRFDS